MLHKGSNMQYRSNKQREILELLKARLPDGWKVSIGPGVGKLVFIAPDRRQGSLLFEYRARLEPREVAALAGASGKRGARLVVSSFLSASTRERLREAGLSHADLTGNVRLALAAPGLFIETQGESRDPRREERPARTLKGPRAGRIVRALCDFRLPLGVRELAARAGVDPGYASRVVALLAREALVVREPRGPVIGLDWERLLRRWAEEAPLATRGVQQAFIEPRGLKVLVERLPSSQVRVAVTGSLASSRLSAVAPPRLAILYVERIDEAAEALALKPAESGANVMLIEPVDPVVFERTRVVDGLALAAPSQVIADLLGSPGRGPEEAEALFAWVRANPEVRSRG